MTWVGVATLVVTACYLLYRFPPSTWTPESGPEPFPKPASAEPTSESQRAAASQDATTNTTSSPLAEEEEGGLDESQSTPKASASNAPALEIPTLHLENEVTTESQADTTPLQNGSARPAAANLTPTPPISTTKTPPTTLMPPPSLPRQQPQNSSSGSSSSLMPPPPPPRLRPTPTMNQQPPQQQSSSLLTPPRAYPPRLSSNSLAPPPSAAAAARARPGASSSGGLAPPTQLRAPPQKAASSKRPVLEPGFSPLDWAALTSNPNNNLRGANLPPNLIRVTPSMLKKQNGRKGTDAWTSFQGKVYNITPYLPFHPGGKGELLRGAGKDSGKLFFEIHPWVNWDAIMGECLVGILVSEHEATEENTLDAMD